ncbi:RHS repeat-associated core domain-containing protein [Arthrobacter halodurans]
MNAWAQYDEYGDQQSSPVDTGTTTYGWHGVDQRAAETSGLILMGARLYNSTTGHFTTRDPVTGGNSTSYTYPQDPVNSHDVSGLAAPLVWLGWAAVRWGIKYYAKKRLFKATNMARAAIRNQKMGSHRGFYSKRTLDLAGRIYTGSRATTYSGIRVSNNGLRGYRSVNSARNAVFRKANFYRFSTPIRSNRAAKRSEKRIANYHVRTPYISGRWLGLGRR